MPEATPRSRYRHPAFVCGLVFALAALIPAGFGLRHLQQGLALQERGVQTDARLERRWFSESVVRGGRRLEFLYAAVSFTDAQGNRIEATDEVRAPLFYRLDERNPVRVTYLPDNPALVEIDPGRRMASARVLGVMTLISAALSLGCFAFARRAWRRA